MTASGVAFAQELDNLVERFRKEFDLSYGELVGVLTLKSHLMANEYLGELQDDDDEGGTGQT